MIVEFYKFLISAFYGILIFFWLVTMVLITGIIGIIGIKIISDFPIILDKLKRLIKRRINNG